MNSADTCTVHKHVKCVKKNSTQISTVRNKNSTQICTVRNKNSTQKSTVGKQEQLTKKFSAKTCTSQ
jgi:hypothetical protein